MEKEEVAFVTDDKWIREESGLLDETDQQIIEEASQGGKFHVRVISIREMIEAMRDKEANKYRKFHKALEQQSGKTLTFEEIIDLAQRGNERLSEFTGIVSSMSLGQATQIRHWRVDNRMTWRSIARAAYREGWFGQQWAPASNQIMGMALAEKAAALFNENYRDEPWN